MQSSLLQRVAAGDQAAVAEVISRYGGLVWSLVRRFVGQGADAEDAAQEVFVDVWKSAARFDPALASEPTFIAMIARRRLIDRVRAAARKPATAPLPDVPPADRGPAADPLQTSEDAARALRAISSLGEDQQRTLRLAVLQGLSHEKIAAATGLPLGTVKTNIRRGLLRVRDALSGAPIPAGEEGRA